MAMAKCVYVLTGGGYVRGASLPSLTHAKTQKIETIFNNARAQATAWRVGRAGGEKLSVALLDLGTTVHHKLF